MRPHFLCHCPYPNPPIPKPHCPALLTTTCAVLRLCARAFHCLAAHSLASICQKERKEPSGEVMRDAVEDHRASSDGEPRTIYGRIVAEADRVIDPETIIRRTVQYGLAHCPELDREEQYARCLAHLQQKYAEGGYLRLWIAESENARRLEELRGVIRDPQRLRKMFDAAFDTETAE